MLPTCFPTPLPSIEINAEGGYTYLGLNHCDILIIAGNGQSPVSLLKSLLEVGTLTWGWPQCDNCWKWTQSPVSYRRVGLKSWLELGTLTWAQPQSKWYSDISGKGTESLLKSLMEVGTLTWGWPHCHNSWKWTQSPVSYRRVGWKSWLELGTLTWAQPQSKWYSDNCWKKDRVPSLLIEITVGGGYTYLGLTSMW